MPATQNRASATAAGPLRTTIALLWVAVMLAGAAFGGWWAVRNFLSEAGWSGQSGSFTVAACQVDDSGSNGDTYTCSGRFTSDDGRTVVNSAYYQDGDLTRGATYDVLRGPGSQIYIPSAAEAVSAASVVFLLVTLLGVGVQAIGWTFEEFDDPADLVGTVLFVIGVLCAGLALAVGLVWWLVDVI